MTDQPALTGPDPAVVLRQRFGHPAFRPGQRAIVEHISAGRDALVVMPTGAGKSLCYQLPALVRGGTTLVVSPLLALMKDQVDALCARGVRATAINSTVSPAERRLRMDGLRHGAFELVYVAPERFTPAFLRALVGVDLRLLAIDEAHCLSQWGHDFRPDYLQLGKVREALGGLATVALTATATPRVQDDIAAVLGISEARRFVLGFDRPNLHFEVSEVTSAQDKLLQCARTVASQVGGVGPALVYCATRKNVEKVVQFLRNAGLPAAMYHAGLEHEQRIQVQDDFMAGKMPVVVSTNAFGMGVDKDDVRLVVHYDLPGSVEAYYQEIGRAGRDGRPSRVVLLFRPEDRHTQEFFIRMAHPPAALVQALWARLMAEGQNPVWRSREALADDLDQTPAAELVEGRVDARTVSSCLAVLQRHGRTRQVAPSDRPARVSLCDPPAGRRPDGLRGQALAWIEGQARPGIEGQARPGERIDLDPGALARALDVAHDQLAGALRGLEDRGWITYEGPARVGGIELTEADLPLGLDEEHMRAQRQRELGRLEEMLGYPRAGCYRRYLLSYFGQKPQWERCGTCSACQQGKALVTGQRRLKADEELVVRKLLATMARMGRPFSASMIAKVAVGSQDKGVLAWKFDRLSTYGILRGWTIHQLEQLLAELTRTGAVQADFASHEVGGHKRNYKDLRLTELGIAVMKQEAPDFEMAWPSGRSVGGASRAETGTPAGPADLVAELRTVRAQLARAGDVPAYVIASNRTLDEIAARRPTNRAALLEVHGMGKERVQRYGQALLDAVRAWTEG